MKKTIHRLKGIMSMFSNTLTQVMIVAILAIGIMMIVTLFMGFETAPKEPVETRSACAMTALLGLSNSLTIHPFLFDKSRIDSWGAGSGMGGDKIKDADMIFEELYQGFFMPDSDYFIEINAEGQGPYFLFVPPESESVFKSCARPGITYPSGNPFQGLSSPSAISEALEEAPEAGLIREKYASYNEIYADCEISAFLANPDDISDFSVASIRAGLTSNIATKLRDGIYRVGVLGQDRAAYPLGPYPQGCIVNEGAYKTEQSFTEGYLSKFSLLNIISGPSGAISGLMENIFGWSPLSSAKEWYSQNRIEYKCGFDWGWETKNQGTESAKTILRVTRANRLFSFGGMDCPIETRIPQAIVEESRLEEKLCIPKQASLRVWLPREDMSNYQYFLKVENARSSWGETNAKDFCERKCRSEAPGYWRGEFLEKCACFCGELSDEIGYCNSDEVRKFDSDCSIKNLIYDSAICGFARSQILLFEKLPQDAIDVQYIAVESSVLESSSGGFSQLSYADYYASSSACAGWPGISDCRSSAQCHSGETCISGIGRNPNLDEHPKDGVCASGCDYDEAGVHWGLCSPSYLEGPPTLDDALFACQSVVNADWSSDSGSGQFEYYIEECLPVIDVEVWKVGRGGNLEPLNSGREYVIDCSEPGNSELSILWNISMGGICCPNIQASKYKKEDGEEIDAIVCSTPPPYCDKMKFWANLDSANVAELIPNQFFGGAGGEDRIVSPDDYVFSLTQQVCRNNRPYNNAPFAGIVANYAAESSLGVGHPQGKGLRYIIAGSEVELR
jgi:hypothetical protein